jgi:hypothetical protein
MEIGAALLHADWLDGWLLGTGSQSKTVLWKVPIHAMTGLYIIISNSGECNFLKYR